jgi:hypothetical protein
MMSATMMSTKLSIVKLNVAQLIAVMLNVAKLIAIMLNVIKPSVNNAYPLAPGAYCGF